MEKGAIIAERWELLEEGGRGGLGVVWRAVDRTSGDIVAVKLLHGSSETGVATNLAWFAREASVLADLTRDAGGHPGVVRHVDHGALEDGTAFLVMEWLDGQPLSRRLASRDQGLTVGETIALGLGVAKALAFAAHHGVVHRDIKPSNLFLRGGDPGQVVVLDFGLARAVDGGGTRLTRTGAIMGTPGYMAPEQARGSRQLDCATDVFSLGCVLFECLAGRQPFAADHVVAVLARILFEEAPALSVLRDDLPTELVDLIAAMLDKEGARRPPPAEVAARIEALGDAEGPAPAGAARGNTLTDSEQRFFSVVLAGRLDGATWCDDQTLQQNPDLEAELAAAKVAAEPFGAVYIERLADRLIACVIRDAGAPAACAYRAAGAALAINKALLETPVALATGFGVVEGGLPLGDVIDRGVALLDMASAPDVLVDRNTAVLLGHRFVIRRQGGRRVLVGEAMEPGRTLLGEWTECVGRRRELRILLGELEECVAESCAKAVLVVAEAGVGKTRLAAELAQRARESVPRLKVLFGAGDPVSGGRPYALLRPMARELLGLRDGDDLSEAGALAPVLQAEASTNATIPDGALRDPAVQVERVRQAWTELVLAKARRTPLLLVLEDLHWADRPSIDLLDATLRDLSDSPLLIVALARPSLREKIDPLWPRRPLTRIQLGPLSGRACAQLVHRVLGEAASPELAERLTHLSGGNALFLEELIRASALGQEATPSTVLGLLQARLERIPADGRRILRAASIFGPVFWPDGLEHLLEEVDEPTIARWLKQLEDRELVRVQVGSTRVGHLEWTFPHALVREASYATLVDADRASGHRRAARWLEAQGVTDALVLATHHVAAGEPTRAVPWLRRAAEDALRAGDLAAAQGLADQAIDAGAPNDVIGALRLLQAEAAVWKDDVEAMRRYADLAQPLLRPGGAGWFHASGVRASANGRLGETEVLVRESRALLGVRPTDPQAALARATALSRVAGQLLHTGNTAEAEEVIEAAAAGSAGDSKVEATLCNARATRAWYAGDMERAFQEYDRGATLLAELGEHRHRLQEQVNAAIALVAMGQYSRAAARLRPTAKDAADLGVDGLQAFADAMLGSAVMRLGRLDEALDCFERATAWYRTVGDARLHAGCRYYLAEHRLLSGDPSAALTLIDEVLPDLEPFPDMQARAVALRGRALLELDKPEAALRCAREGLTEDGTGGARAAGEPLLRVVLCEALDRTGDAAAARAELIALWRAAEQRAARIGNDAMRQSFLEQVPENKRMQELMEEWGLSP